MDKKEKAVHDMVLVKNEVLKAVDSGYTGTFSVNFHMNQGGISQISLILNKNLKNQ